MFPFFCFLLSFNSVFAVDRDKFDSLVIYQIMVTSFVDGNSSIGYDYGFGPQNTNFKGDLYGVYDHLEDIASNGFNAIWLTPIFDSLTELSPSLFCKKLDGTGYFAGNYFKIDPNFGSEAQFKKLVDHAHELGLYVFLDGVFGHWKLPTCGCKQIVKSPSGKLPKAVNKSIKIPGDLYNKYYADYPASLDFFTEVVQYWISNFNIDGWRLDQVCQIRSINNTDYSSHIRIAVEEICDKRKLRGEHWGTLGYVVGEHWNSEYNHIKNVYGKEGDSLYSFFDFPGYDEIIRVFGASNKDNKTYGPDKIFEILQNTKKIYPTFAHSNMFLSNHDVWRFGNVIQKRYPQFTVNTIQYWNMFQSAYVALSLYNGPITVLYGDEIGTYLHGYEKDFDLGAKNDNMGRYNLKTDVLTPFEMKMKKSLSNLLNYRKTNKVMYHKDSEFILLRNASNLIEFKKVFVNENNKTVEIYYFLNYYNIKVTRNHRYIGKNLTDIVTGDVLNSAHVDYEPYQARLLISSDDDSSNVIISSGINMNTSIPTRTPLTSVNQQQTISNELRSMILNSLGGNSYHMEY
ncbi:Alpha amylase [Entamoeba marina]